MHADRRRARSSSPRAGSTTRRSSVRPSCGGWGCDAAWADDFHHALRVLADRRHRGLLRGVRRARARSPRRSTARTSTTAATRRSAAAASARPPTTARREQFVVFAQNHDQVGNRALGDRLPEPRRGRWPRSARCCHRSRRCCSWARSTASRRRSSSSPTTSTRRSPTATREGRRGSSPRSRALRRGGPRPAGPRDVRALQAHPRRATPSSRELYGRLLRAAPRAAATARRPTSPTTSTRGWLRVRRGAVPCWSRTSPTRACTSPSRSPATIVLATHRRRSSRATSCSRPLVGSAAAMSQEVWPGRPFPLGATVGRAGHELLAVLRERRARRAVPVRRRGQRDAHRADRAHRVQLALLPARHRSRAALRLPRPRALRARGGPPLQPARSCSSTPTRSRSRARSAGSGGNVLPYVPRTDGIRRRRPRARRRGRRPTRCPSRWSSTRASTGRATSRPTRRSTRPSSTRRTSRASRCATPDVREDLRGTYAGLASERRDRVPQGPRRHRGRAAAGPPHRRRGLPRRARA